MNTPYPSQESSTEPQLVYDQVLETQALRRSFVWMALGLAITGVAALLSADINLAYTLATSRLLWVLLIAEMALVWFLSSRMMTLSMPVATGGFVLYALLMGLTISPIFLLYTEKSIATTFFITSGTFALTALYGYTTKRSLASMRSFLMMALIGLVLTSVVNIFLQSPLVLWITSGVGVLLFTALTAYDTQTIKEMVAQTAGDEELSKRVSLLGALRLYLDFVNLFLYLLRFYGRRD